MNKHLVVWGLLLLIGFLATHFIAFSADPVYVIPLWVIIAALGLVYSKGCCCAKSRFGRKCECCFCSCNGIWAIALAEGIVLTVAIMIQLLAISQFYILSVWLLAMGSAAVAESLMKKKAIELQLGLFWLFSAVFFPFVSNYQGASLLIGALVMGVPLILAGIVKKE